MALPTGNIAWPPATVGKEISRVQGYAAWYAGDKSILYPQSGAVPAPGRSWLPSWLPANPLGGLNGTRTGWGETNPMHVPVAADLARTSADLLFSDCPDITVGTEPGGPEAARWEEIEDGSGFEAGLLEAGELAAALSGIYGRVTFDRVNEPRWPILSWVHPDNAWPEWSWGRLSAVTFWRVLSTPPGQNARSVWRHLERHSMTVVNGRPAAMIEHGMYVGEGSKLGVRVPLTDHPELAMIALSLTAEDMIVMPGVTRTATYVPNMLPNRLDRGSRLGRPDIEQQEDLLRGVNDTWTSWLRDLRLGKGRVVVPREYLRVGSPGQGATFDYDREVYEALNALAPAGGQQSLTVVQFAIRVAEHEATLRAQVERIVTSAGYNLFSFGMQDANAAAATATEVDARTDLSLVTKAKKARYWGSGLRELVSAIMTMDAFFRYPGAVAIDPATVRVEIEKDIAPRPQDVAQTVNLLAQAKAASTQTLVGMVHPEWTPQEVLDETNRIMQEQGVPVADPTALGGATGASAVDALLAGMQQEQAGQSMMGALAGQGTE